MMRAFATFRNSGAMIVLVVTYAVFSVAAPSFFGLQNLLDITHVISPMIIVATGMALVVMSGKLDISVGSIAYVASAVFALIMRNGSLSVPAAVVASTAAGVGLGCVNAAIVVGLRVNSLIATLGTMIAFRGLGLFMTDGGLIVLPERVKKSWERRDRSALCRHHNRPCYSFRCPIAAPSDDLRTPADSNRKQ